MEKIDPDGPWFVISARGGGTHCIPFTCFERLIAGDISIGVDEDWEGVIRTIVCEWLNYKMAECGE